MAKREISKREKVILGFTVVVCLGALVWIGYLEKFIADYQGVSERLATAKKTFVRQRKSLQNGHLVEKSYREIEVSLPPSSGKLTPDMQFTQELARLFKDLSLGVPSINPPKFKEVEGAEDFIYMVLPVSGISVSIEQMSKLLKGMHERNLVVEQLRIQASGSRKRAGSLQVNVDVARLVQTKDLAPEDQDRVVRRR